MVQLLTQLLRLGLCGRKAILHFLLYFIHLLGEGGIAPFQLFNSSLVFWIALRLWRRRVGGWWCVGCWSHN